MIEINLLPDELKRRTQQSAKNAEAQRLLFIVPVIVGVLVLVHLLLAAAFLVRSYQVGALSIKWKLLEPQRKTLDTSKREYEALFQDARIIQQLAGSQVHWAQRLSAIAQRVPPGVWCNELVFTAKDFLLRCSVVSTRKDEMALVSKFIDNLRSDPAFLGDIAGIELSGVQMKKVGGYDVVDFTLTAKPKGRQ